MRGSTFSLALATLVLSGCDSTPLHPPGWRPFEEDELLLAIAHYRDGELELLNPEPVASRAVDGRYVRIWASPEIADGYVDIGTDGAGLDGLPPGSLIVRELTDEAGVVKKLTAVARGARGSNPIAGDLWFASTTPDGTPLLDEAGAPLVGALPECSGCHMARRSHGFLYGFPND